MRAHFGLLTAAIVLAMTAPASVAHAYIDPGTGSYLFQLLLGSVMAAGVLIKVYWQSVKNVFARRKPGAPDDEHDE